MAKSATKAKPVQQDVTALLNRHLADAIDLQAQVKQAHWNVRGAGFIALHRLFDEVAAAAGDWGDMMAERAGALGAESEGTAQRAVRATTLPPYTLGIAGCDAHAAAVAAALQAFGDGVRASIDAADAEGDAVTADVFTEVARAADLQRYLVMSHMEP